MDITEPPPTFPIKVHPASLVDNLSEEGGQLEALGIASILLEPVRADIRIARDIRRSVRLDHDGRETDNRLSPFFRARV